MTTTTSQRRSPSLQGLPPNLPGADLIRSGIASLVHGEHTAEALLVAIATARLRALGLNVPEAADGIRLPNLALYAAVRDGGGGHFEYNALLGRLASFADAAEWLLRETARNAENGVSSAHAGIESRCIRRSTTPSASPPRTRG